MIDFSFVDFRLLFPGIAESMVLMLEGINKLLYLVGIVLMVIGEWKLFKKFGEKSWKSLVPFYNTYLLYKHTWSRKAFGFYMLSSVLFNIAQTASQNLAQHNPNSLWPTIILLLAVPFGIVAAVCSILYAIRMAEAFGKRKLFCVGLLILYPVFIAILGFGRSKYIGVPEEDREADIADDLRCETEGI